MKNKIFKKFKNMFTGFDTLENNQNTLNLKNQLFSAFPAVNKTLKTRWSN